jgi:hypothetical protein
MSHWSKHRVSISGTDAFALVAGLGTCREG